MRINRGRVFNQFIKSVPPCAVIESGARLTVETQDALFGCAEAVRDGRIAHEECRTRANPATGPLYIKDARPGDVLEVRIHEIRLVGKGVLNVPNTGTPTAHTYNGYEYIEAEALVGGCLRVLASGKAVPAFPMIGVIGTAADADAGHYAVEAGDYGGNMDNPAIRAGAVVYLPVFVAGGLLGLGDVHGVMGEGEVFGQGLEMASEVDITVVLRKDMCIKRPLVETSECLSAAASAETMEQASDWAVRDMLDILQDMHGLTPAQAAAAIAFYGDLRVCQVVNAQKTMRMEIRKKYIPLFQS